MWNSDFQWAQPQWLWGLLIIPVLGLYLIYRRKVNPAFRLPSSSNWTISNWKTYARVIPQLMMLMALALALLAMARPQKTHSTIKKSGMEGIDIVMALDVSSSMLAQDLQPNRLEALKRVAAQFVDQREDDRIALVVYAGEAYTQMPLTTDHAILKESIAQLKDGMLENGTAIGSGLATAINRLENSQAKSKVIILLTDGENNSGIIDPKAAASIAADRGIKVYTIAVGTKGMAKQPVMYSNGQLVYQYAPVNIDEELLKYIATTTRANYFRATDNNSLSAIYEKINQLEKSEIESVSYSHHEELFSTLIEGALLLISVGLLLQLTLFRSAL